MSLHRDREDTSTQEAAVAAAREELRDALAGCAGECAAVSKALRTKRLSTEKVTALVGGAKAEWLAVERAEETLLIALHDLAGARGEDL